MLFSVAEQFRNFAFGDPASELSRQQWRAALELAGQRVEHPRRDMRNARHDEDIAVADTGSAGHLIGDKLCALGHARHAQATFVDAAASLVIFVEHSARLWVDDYVHT